MSECIKTLPVRYGPATEPSLFALRGIRFFDGENGAGGGGSDGDSGDGDNDGDEGNDGGQGAGDNSSGDGDRQQQRGNRSSGTRGDRGAGKDGTFSREYVSELRTENAARRKNEGTLSTRAETAERERDEARQEAATLRRERAIERTAPKAGANPSALLDSREFATATKDLDLSDGEAVEKAIKEFVEKHPHVAAAPSGPGSSGSGRPGGSSNEGPKNTNSLAGAVSAALGG